MSQLVALLEAIPDGEAWHLGIGEEEFFLSDFEEVDPSIYGRGGVVLANVAKVLHEKSAITARNKIEFEATQVTFVKSIDGLRTIYSK